MTDPRFSIIPAGAVLDPSVEPRDLQVLCLFGRHINDNGWCRRSQVQMAKEIGCARSTVQASIDRLAAAGWLEKRPANDHQTPGVRESAHEYRVVLDGADRALPIVGTQVGTPADLSAPLPTISENGEISTNNINGLTPPAGGAALEKQGVSGVRKRFSSAPSITFSSNEKKEARTRLDPTEGLVVVAEDSEDFALLTQLRGGRRPVVGRNFTTIAKIADLEAARAKYGVAGDMGGRAA